MHTITVAYVNPPKEGKRNGSIKTVEGAYYDCPPALLGMFAKGGTYNVNTTSREWQGRTFHTIASLEAQPTAPDQAARRFAPDPKPNGNGAYLDAERKKQEQIFVQGILQAYIKAGLVQLNPTQITHAISMLQSVWGESFGE